MPRWLFILLCAALGLSVAGGVLIVARSPTTSPGASPAASSPPHAAGERPR